MEKQKKEIIIGNTTTVINTIALMISGAIFGVLASLGLKLPFDMYALASVIGIIIMTGFSYINAKYKNTYFDKDEDKLTIDLSKLSDQQVTAIQTFLENTTVNVAGKTFNKYNDSQIFDNDAPVLNDEYTINNDDNEGC